MDPAVSPDGTQIAATILGKIWVMPIEGGDAVQVSTGPGWDRRRRRSTRRCWRPAEYQLGSTEWRRGLPALTSELRSK